MGEKWESDSLRWIHEVREENYKRTKRKSLQQLPLGPSRAVEALIRTLGLRRTALRPEERLARKRKVLSR